MIAPGKPVAPGAIDRTPVISMDLSATILEAAHVELCPDEPLDGTTLRPLLQGDTLDRGPLFFHYPHYAWHRSNRPGGAIRSGPYKLIRPYDDESIELYDLSTDIGEQNNLASEKPELAAELDGQLRRWLVETKAQMPDPRK